MTAPVITITHVHELSPETAKALHEVAEALRDAAKQLAITKHTIDVIYDIARRSLSSDTSVGEAEARGIPTPSARPREAADTDVPQPQLVPEPDCSVAAAPQPAGEPPAPADPIAPPAPPAKARTGPVTGELIWTEERNALLRRDWPAGVAVEDILPKINAMPGRPRTITQLGVQASYLKLRRPAGYLAAIGRTRAADAPPTPPAPPASPAAATPAPASAQAVSKPRHVPIWSEERKAILVREYPRGTSLDAIYGMVLVLPGPAPSRDALHVIAAHLGLKRPPPLPPIQRTPPSAEPQITNFATIAAWSGPRGIPFDGSNLEAVNKKRAALGMGPFVLERVEPRRAGAV